MEAAAVTGSEPRTEAGRDVLRRFGLGDGLSESDILAIEAEAARVSDDRLREARSGALDSAIAIVQQSLDSSRYAAGSNPDRADLMVIAARDHIIKLLTHYRDRIAAALPAADRAEPVLDVELLVKAIVRHWHEDDGDLPPLAERIAAEYAALSEAQTDGR